jgi:hypothetical protein
MNLLLLKSNSGYSELIDFIQLMAGKFKYMEFKEMDNGDVFITLSQYDDKYNKEGGEDDVIEV